MSIETVVIVSNVVILASVLGLVVFGLLNTEPRKRGATPVKYYTENSTSLTYLYKGDMPKDSMPACDAIKRALEPGYHYRNIDGEKLYQVTTHGTVVALRTERRGVKGDVY